MCKKKISKNSDKWFCSKECENEWKLLNADLKKVTNKKVKGRDTSS